MKNINQGIIPLSVDMQYVSEDNAYLEGGQLSVLYTQKEYGKFLYAQKVVLTINDYLGTSGTNRVRKGTHVIESCDVFHTKINANAEGPENLRIHVYARYRDSIFKIEHKLHLYSQRQSNGIWAFKFYEVVEPYDDFNLIIEEWNGVVSCPNNEDFHEYLKMYYKTGHVNYVNVTLLCQGNPDEDYREINVKGNQIFTEIDPSSENRLYCVQTVYDQTVYKVVLEEDGDGVFSGCNVEKKFLGKIVVRVETDGSCSSLDQYNNVELNDKVKVGLVSSNTLVYYDCVLTEQVTLGGHKCYLGRYVKPGVSISRNLIYYDTVSCIWKHISGYDGTALVLEESTGSNPLALKYNSSSLLKQYTLAEYLALTGSNMIPCRLYGDIFGSGLNITDNFIHLNYNSDLGFADASPYYGISPNAAGNVLNIVVKMRIQQDSGMVGEKVIAADIFMANWTQSGTQNLRQLTLYAQP